MRQSLWVIGATWLLLTIASCHERKVYDHYTPTPLEGWAKDDTVTFLLPKAETEGVYGMDLKLRSNGSYPFMGITLIVEKTFFPSLFKSTDTIPCLLREENGMPRQQGVSYYQNIFHIGEIHLNSGDSLQVTVRHDMKRELLPGIGDVGIMLTKY